MLTIVCANCYWGNDTRYRYVLEFRGFFNPHSKPATLTPIWAIELEQYALGFWPARYPVPMVI